MSCNTLCSQPLANVSMVLFGEVCVIHYDSHNLHGNCTHSDIFNSYNNMFQPNFANMPKT